MHEVSADVVKEVVRRLLISIEITQQTFKLSDPLVVFEVYDRLTTLAHCCKDGEDDPPWAT